MGRLLDTCVLVRLADQHSREHRVADAALEHLLARNELLFISAQVLAEFWAVATRPEAVNGLGWSIATASEAIIGLREQFPLLTETADTVDRWFELVNRCQVAGKRAHDARLAALLLAHGVQQVLTFNTADILASGALTPSIPTNSSGSDLAGRPRPQAGCAGQSQLADTRGLPGGECRD